MRFWNDHAAAVFTAAERNVDAYELGYPQCRTVFYTLKALGNYKLARETDIQEALDQAVNKTVAGVLVDRGACWAGLNTVGIPAENWFDLGYRIAKADREDWLSWCREELDDCSQADLSEVEAGYFVAGGGEPVEDDYDD